MALNPGEQLLKGLALEEVKPGGQLLWHMAAVWQVAEQQFGASLL